MKNTKTIVLGVNAGHDASAALVVDGEIIASVMEERFTRVKNDASFPHHAISYCLEAGGIASEDIDILAIGSQRLPDECSFFFEFPTKMLSRLGKAVLPKRLSHLYKKIFGDKGNPFGLPLYHKPMRLRKDCKVYLCPHHRAHAASAYFTSGLYDEKVVVVAMDGLGDGISVSVWRANKNRLKLVKKYDRTGSLAWFYGNATEALGWRQASEEWKVMGLAPYGTPRPGALRGFYPEYKNGELVRPYEFPVHQMWPDHGTYHWHNYDADRLKIHVKKMGEEDFAAEVQRVSEEQAMNFIVPWIEREKTGHFCFAGGFFLNVKLNQKLWNQRMLETQWIFPNAGDAGLALGAALDAYYGSNPEQRASRIEHLYWGPEYTDNEIKQILDERKISYTYYDDPVRPVAEYLRQNLTVGWFQGRMEDGPRALGNRSILMSPLRAENKDIINSKIKFREFFRPFCPSILEEKYHDYLSNAREEKFMVTSFDVSKNKSMAIPAVVHKDNTVRPQMVSKKANPLYWHLINCFGELTGEYVILNTSFNIKGEPIICHPREAIRCFFDTGLDVLVLGHYILEKPVLGSYNSTSIKQNR